MVVLALSLLGVAPAGAAQAVTVTPTTNLVDGQVVTISGSGFQPNASIATCEGVFETPPFTVSNCGATGGNIGVSFNFSADGSGNFSGSFTVVRFLKVGNQFVDCADGSNPCSIAAADFPALSTISVVPIAFAPQPPASPRPDIMVKNRATGELYGDNYYDPTGGGVQRRVHAEVNGTWTYAVIVQNDGNALDDLTISAPAAPGVQYFSGYFDITTGVTSGGITLTAVPPGGSFLFAVRESGLAPGGSLEDLVTVRSSGWAPFPADAVSLVFESSIS